MKKQILNARYYVLYGLAIILRFAGLFNKLDWAARDKIINLFMSVDGVSELKFHIKYEGYNISVGLNSYIHSKIFFYGLYERCELKILGEYARKLNKCTCLDIGANVGAHSLYMSKFDHVHSFEPYDTVRRVLDQCIQDNNINNISVHKVAISDYAGTDTLYIPKGSNHGMGFIDSNDDRDGVDYYECEIPLVHGDEFLKQKNIKNVDVLKIDVEGYEPTVLKGLRNTILVNRPLLLVEYTKDTHVACNSSFEEFKRLFPNNYKFQAVKKRLPKYKAFPARQVCFLEDVGDTPYYGNIICTPCDT